MMVHAIIDEKEFEQYCLWPEREKALTAQYREDLDRLNKAHIEAARQAGKVAGLAVENDRLRAKVKRLSRRLRDLLELKD